MEDLQKQNQILRNEIAAVSVKYNNLRKACELQMNEDLPCSGQGFSNRCSAVVFFNQVQEAIKE